jgi:hypothetical protein
MSNRIGRAVVAYHAQVKVRHAGDVYTMEIDRDDWCPDRQALKEAGAELGVATVGEVFQKLAAQGKVGKDFAKQTLLAAPTFSTDDKLSEL